jgi:hypothetical protein
LNEQKEQSFQTIQKLILPIKSNQTLTYRTV